MALRLSSLRPGRPDKPKMPPSGNMYPTVQANRDMKKTSLLGACILALAMSMGSGEAVAKTPPDQLIIGMNMNNLLTLDPAAMTGNEVVGIVVNLYDSLVELDPEQLTTVRPALAKSWDISPDGKTLTFHLRDDVKFHSGNPLTAADVVWSMRRILHLNLAQRSSCLQTVGGNPMASVRKISTARSARRTASRCKSYYPKITIRSW